MSGKQIVTDEQMVDILNTLYNKSLSGIPKVSKSVDELVDSYMKNAKSPEEAAKTLINYQIAKCGTSGFVTGLGGFLTLPVAVPANVSSVLYVQLRMIAAIAKIGGYDINSDQVQTMTYACLTGSAIADVIKQTGIKVGTKVSQSVIKSIPGKVLTSINQKVGFRLVTKMGQKGIVNLIDLVPVAGGIIGGAIDIGSTNIVAANAYSLFIKNQVPDSKDNKSILEDIQKGTAQLQAGVKNGLSDIQKKTANIQIPQIKMPEIKAAGFKAPEIKLPEIKLPNINSSSRTVTIETGRLVLRPWKESDAEECYKYTSDPIIGDNTGFPAHKDVEDSRSVIKHVLSAPETYAVVLKETGLPIGSVCIKHGDASNCVRNDKEAELGCWVGKPYWGNGYIPEAINALIARCYGPLNCTGIWYAFYDGNERSKRVAEKCGFKYHHTVIDEEVKLLNTHKTTHYWYQEQPNRQ